MNVSRWRRVPSINNQNVSSHFYYFYLRQGDTYTHKWNVAPTSSKQASLRDRECIIIISGESLHSSHISKTNVTDKDRRPITSVGGSEGKDRRIIWVAINEPRSSRLNWSGNVKNEMGSLYSQRWHGREAVGPSHNPLPWKQKIVQRERQTGKRETICY